MIHDWDRQPAKTYGSMVADYAKQHGLDRYPVITRREHPKEWVEWTEYYRFRRLAFSLELMTERSHATVPCLSPIDFDPEYRQPGLGVGHDQRFGGI